MMPVVFVGHGSPMNIIDDNQFTRAFSKIGQIVTKPKAILAISAHWLTRGTRVLNSLAPKTVYDFGGFPEELYRVKYPVDGYPEIATLLSKHNPQLVSVDEWGIDHGTWSVLVHMFPKHDIPVLQMSLNKNLNFKEHFELAKEIQFLRNQGVLILTSGNIVHNLRQIKWESDAEPFDWATEFDSVVFELISESKFSAVAELPTQSSHLFQVAHPTYEHFLPLLYALGAADAAKPTQVVSRGTQNGSISMTSYLFD